MTDPADDRDQDRAPEPDKPAGGQPRERQAQPSPYHPTPRPEGIVSDPDQTPRE